MVVDVSPSFLQTLATSRQSFAAGSQICIRHVRDRSIRQIERSYNRERTSKATLAVIKHTPLTALAHMLRCTLVHTLWKFWLVRRAWTLHEITQVDQLTKNHVTASQRAYRRMDCSYA